MDNELRWDRWLLALGAASGFIAVAAGAFGAHALKRRLPEDLLPVFETGARYQMYHALALVAVGLWLAKFPAPEVASPVRWGGLLFVAGTVLFSGSLYALALSGVRVLGAITPVGGLCFLGGWLALFVAAWRMR